MPELPEVETVRQSLQTCLRGAVIECAHTFRKDLRFPFPEGFTRKLTGARIIDVYRWAKYLLLHIETAQHEQAHWLTHLGMSGQYRVIDADTPREKHDHFQADFSNGARLYYRDPRRFGFMLWVDNLERIRPFNHIGREAIFTEGTHPLARSRGLADADYLYAQFSQRHSSLKSVLLNQNLIAGLGNIYVNEALWEVGADPETPAKNLPKQLYPALTTAIENTLIQALRSGGSSLRDFVHIDGKLGYFQHQWNVYGQTHQPCKKSGCTGIIQQKVQNGRSSFFCPKHQLSF